MVDFIDSLSYIFIYEKAYVLKNTNWVKIKYFHVNCKSMICFPYECLQSVIIDLEIFL